MDIMLWFFGKMDIYLQHVQIPGENEHNEIF